MDVKKMGKFIADCRKEKKLTQEEFAKKLNVSYSSITKWENGYYSPDIALLVPICKILDISLEELFSGEHIDKDEDDGINTIKAIKYYKNRLRNIMILIITIIIMIFFAAIIIRNYFYDRYNFKIASIGSNDDKYELMGNMFYNNTRTIINIYDFTYNDIYVGTAEEKLVTEMQVYLYLDNTLLTELKPDVLIKAYKDKKYFINDYLELFHIYYDTLGENSIKITAKNIKDIQIIVNYIDDKGIAYRDTIPLINS